MLTLPRNSDEFKTLLDKYMEIAGENYEPNNLVFNNQPYSLNSAKLWIFGDETVEYDPFGYYS